MSKELQRRKKIALLMKDLALIETTKRNPVPAAVSDYILGEYGLANKSNVDNVSPEEVNEFACKIEDLIKDKSKLHKEKDERCTGSDEDSKNNFSKACESFVNAKGEYLQVTLQLNALLNEIIKFREKYSEHLKQKSFIKQDELEVLEKKLQFLKLQSFLKFYGENNAFDAHLKLREILAARLKSLKLQHNDLVELDAKYCDLKNNKDYSNLLQTYKQLLKKEKKIDYMIEE